jgi:hypothetical protein
MLLLPIFLNAGALMHQKVGIWVGNGGGDTTFHSEGWREPAWVEQTQRVQTLIHNTTTTILCHLPQPQFTLQLPAHLVLQNVNTNTFRVWTSERVGA